MGTPRYTRPSCWLLLLFITHPSPSITLASLTQSPYMLRSNKRREQMDEGRGQQTAPHIWPNDVSNDDS